MKKVLALLMAAVLLLGLGATAFAEEPTTGSITINDAAHVSVAGKTFNAYKILDATFTSNPTEDKVEGQTGVAYTVPEEMADFYAERYTLNKSDVDFGEQVAAKIAAESDLFAFAADALAAANAAGVVPGSEKAGDAAKSVTIGNLPFGYYVVEDAGTETPISALMLQTVGGVTVNIKADKPDIDKIILEADTKNGKGTAQDVGSVVKFELTSRVPSMEGYKKYVYKVHDTMSAGLTFDPKSVVVTIGGHTMAKDTDYTVKSPADGETFLIEMDLKALEKAEKITANDEIVITYNATINENALKTKEETNTVYLEYSNNPNPDVSGKPTDVTPPEKVYVYDFDIVIDKYASKGETDEDKSEKLAGAEFVLYKNAKEGKVYYKLNGNKVEWVETIDEADKLITDKNGVVRFTGLDTGTYYLEETKAPAGYNKLKEPIEVIITATYNPDGTISNTNAVVVENQYQVNTPVANKTGTVLPETGGIGTTIFYILGGIMVAGAVILLITKKRMANEK